MTRFGRLAAGALAASVLAGCWTASEPPSAPARVNAPAVSDFTLQSVDGASVSLGGFLGRSVVLLDFTATWCHFCDEALPTLKALHAAHGGRLALLSIDEEEPLDLVKAESARKGITHTVLLDPDGAVRRKYGVDGYPTFVLIGLDRQVLYYGSDPRELSAAVDAAMK